MYAPAPPCARTMTFLGVLMLWETRERIQSVRFRFLPKQPCVLGVSFISLTCELGSAFSTHHAAAGNWSVHCGHASRTVFEQRRANSSFTYYVLKNATEAIVPFAFWHSFKVRFCPGSWHRTVLSSWMPPCHQRCPGGPCKRTRPLTARIWDGIVNGTRQPAKSLIGNIALHCHTHTHALRHTVTANTLAHVFMPVAYRPQSSLESRTLRYLLFSKEGKRLTWHSGGRHRGKVYISVCAVIVRQLLTKSVKTPHHQ